jgi:hypothetical protein
MEKLLFYIMTLLFRDDKRENKSLDTKAANAP